MVRFPLRSISRLNLSTEFTTPSMSMSFLPDDVNQSVLFPPLLHDWLPERHLARLAVDVVSVLDLRHPCLL